MERYFLMQQQMADQQARRDAASQRRRAERQEAFYWDQQNRLNAEYQKKIDEANQKNESRYLDILEGRTGTRDRVLGDLAGYGQNQIANANERYKAAISRAEADVYSRGLGGSPSLLSGARLPAEAQRGRELADINNDIISRRTGADIGLSDSMYGFMERRNDVPPDLNQLIALQQGLGRGGYGLFGTGPGGGRGAPWTGVEPLPSGTAGGTPWGGAVPLPIISGAPWMGAATGATANPGMVRPSPGRVNDMGPPGASNNWWGHGPPGTPPPAPPAVGYGGTNGNLYTSYGQPGLPRRPAFRTEALYLPPPAATANTDAARRAAVLQDRFLTPQQQFNQELSRTKSNIMQAEANTGGYGTFGDLERLQQQAVYRGLADYQPGQKVPTVPGAAGDFGGASYYYPSLVAGIEYGGYTPRGDYTGMNPYGKWLMNRPKLRPYRGLYRRPQVNQGGWATPPANFAYA